MSGRIDVMSKGDAVSHSLGINAKKQRITMLVVVSMTVSAVVSFTGTIGFVGLVAPHMARIFTGPGSKYLIPASGLAGALVLTASECIAKVLGGIPVGVITALIGCPLFIFLLLRQKRDIWS
jgi:ABC-type Fe3+-siderophore transport system permease subunit